MSEKICSKRTALLNGTCFLKAGTVSIIRSSMLGLLVGSIGMTAGTKMYPNSDRGITISSDHCFQLTDSNSGCRRWNPCDTLAGFCGTRLLVIWHTACEENDSRDMVLSCFRYPAVCGVNPDLATDRKASRVFRFSEACFPVTYFSEEPLKQCQKRWFWRI